MKESSRWKGFESFSESAEKFGSSGGIVTMGFGGSPTSPDAKKSTYSLL